MRSITISQAKVLLTDLYKRRQLPKVTNILIDGTRSHLEVHYVGDLGEFPRDTFRGFQVKWVQNASDQSC